MIFVTVGTHEQGMDRLFKQLDILIENGSIKEEVFAQIGYSEYIPKNYGYKKMIGYDEMDSYIKKANIVITHGGPGSIFHPLRYGKIPIVVPRNPKLNEHVDDHQILFTKRLEKSARVLAVYEMDKLEECVKNYKSSSKIFLNNCSNTDMFVIEFDKLLQEKFKI